ncbi:hypothetical protein HanHA300_Chr14g0508211 [Helianthus annuus]|nr:hypothetical protein HanHA300_Chr14g0508211 [Helianthus annuus]KAJ0658453.1 hypothetical protein HanOQP8_Chr14g0508431 [Helianthus annuus]
MVSNSLSLSFLNKFIPIPFILHQVHIIHITSQASQTVKVNGQSQRALNTSQKVELSHYPQLERNFVPKFGKYLLRKLGRLHRSLVFLGCHILPPLIWNFAPKFRGSSFSLSSGCIGSE